MDIENPELSLIFLPSKEHFPAPTWIQMAEIISHVGRTSRTQVWFDKPDGVVVASVLLHAVFPRLS